jgi:phage tail tape-measure protein
MPPGTGTINTINLIITGNPTQAQAALAGVITSLNNAGHAVRSVGTSSRNASQYFLNMGNSARAASTHVRGLLDLYILYKGVVWFRNISEDLVETASSFEKLENAMNRIVGSQSKARREMAWITDLGKSTYGVLEIGKAFVKMKTIGMDPTEDKLRGLIGYLLTVGRTGEHEMMRVVNAMARLQQAGTIGMDDSLKELLSEVPFAMAALSEYLGRSFYELMRDFKKRSIDFDTINRAVFAYTTKYFKDGIEQTKNFWDRLVMVIEAKKELFKKAIMDSDAFATLKKYIDGLIKEIDSLESDGTLNAWANDMGKSLSDIIKQFGLSGIGAKDLLRALKDLLVAARDVAPSIRIVSGAAGGFAQVIGGLISAYDKLPDFAKGPLGVGIIGALLFGPKAGLVLGAMSAIYDQIEKGSKKIDEIVQKSNTSQMPSGQQSFPGARPTFKDGSPIPTSGDEQLDKVLKDKPWLKKFRGSGGDTVLRAEIAKQEIAASDAIASGQRMKDELDALRAQARQQTQSFAAGLIEMRAAQESVSRGFTAPGETSYVGVAIEFFNQANDLQGKMKTIVERMISDENLAGTDQFERYKASMQNRLNEYMTYVKQRSDAIAKFSEAVQKAGDPRGIEDAKKMFAILESEVETFQSNMDLALTREKEKWDELGRKHLFDIKTTIERFFKMEREGEQQMSSIVDEMGVSINKNWGRGLDAEQLQIQQKVDSYISQIKTMGERLKIARDEVLSSMGKGIRFDTTDSELIAMVDQLNKLVDGWPDKEKLLMSQVDAFKNYHSEVARIKKSGTLVEGMQLGFAQFGDTVETEGQRGLSIVSALRDSFDGLSASVAQFAVTGKFNISSFMTSFLQSIVQMTLKALIFDKVMRAIGLAGQASFTSQKLMPDQYIATTRGHTGSVIGYGGGAAAFVPAMAFYGAPRLHSGLAPDEFPFIGKRNEEIVSSSDRGKIIDHMKNQNAKPVSVTVNIKNESGQPVQVNQRGVQIDANEMMLDMVISAASSNPSKRSALKQIMKG